ncbi:pyridoxal phosphate-dependent aminotransferase [Portibacter lacus]|uniref:Aminotransferase n=1 Tax=Portibacter lacus TaxID=1099794 RepID=A0AA37SRX5_9BACT|nr:pyridoxal phosphate-dependent aminotransferase [Portibacter lacus]GLR18444.1 aminotransferase [Portibacter lacus]
MENLLSKRVSEMSESATIKMAQMARELKTQGKDVISLSLGEPDFDTPDHIKEAAKVALDEGFTKYTPVPGLLELRNAIVEKFKRENGLTFTANQIVVSNGAKQCVYNLCMSLLNPGDEVIIFTPYWVSYADIVKLAGGVPVFVNSTIDDDFKVKPEAVRAAITDKTKAVLFSSPCNPTGSVYTAEELEAIANVIGERDDIIIFSDEIYELINFGGKHASIGSFDSVKDQTVTINGFSKGYSMTGWRLGYIGAPQWIASACAKIQGQVTSGANAFGQRAAIVALEGDQQPSVDMKNAFEKRKHMVRDLLSEIPGIKINDPQGAFYLFPDVSSYFGKSYGEYNIENSEDFAAYILQEALVGTVGGGAFGADDCIRISYAASEEELKEAMKRIKDALALLK